MKHNIRTAYSCLLTISAATALFAVPAVVAPAAHGATPAPACGNTALIKADGTPWACTFDDEFDGSALDNTAWTPQITSASGFSSGPIGSQVCYINSPDTISEQDGYLRLSVVREPSPFWCGTQQAHFGTQYAGGSVSTYNGFTQTYGRFEVRAQLPQTTVQGLQETFWLYPRRLSYGAWPASGEIDFAEFYSQYADYNIPYVHYRYDTSTTSAATTNTNTVTAFNCTIDHTAFNTYAVEWQPGRIAIYVNGNTCLVDNYVASGLTSPAPFDQPFMIVLTQALGGMGTNAFDPVLTPLPATTLVDYVRAWQ